MSVSAMLSQTALADVKAFSSMSAAQLKEMVQDHIAHNSSITGGAPIRGAGLLVVVCLRRHCYVLVRILKRTRSGKVTQVSIEGVARQEAPMQNRIRELRRRI